MTTGQRIAVAQGGYYLASGVWPVLHMASFVAVTGPKTDVWLVQSFGVLVAAVGAVLLVRGVRGRVDQGTQQFGLVTALALVAIDYWFVLTGAISAIYLLDGFAELLLVQAWLGLFGRVVVREAPGTLEPRRVFVRRRDSGPRGVTGAGSAGDEPRSQ